MNGKQTGYFTEEDLDRMNLKSMANPLHEPWDGHHLMAFLVTAADYGIQQGMSPEESKDKVVEYYCTNTSEQIIKDLEVMSKTPQFHAVLELQRLMYADPEGVAEAFEAIRNGWEPGDPKP